MNPITPIARLPSVLECRVCLRSIVIENCAHAADVAKHPDRYCYFCWQENPTIARLPRETFTEWIIRLLDRWEGMEPLAEMERRTR